MSRIHEKPRVALFVESHEGFGHFNIVSQLARRLQEQGAEVMVLSGTLDYAGAGQTFNFENARIVHLPPVHYTIDQDNHKIYKTPDGRDYDTATDYVQARKDMVRNAIAAFRPHVVMSELYPFLQSFRAHDIDAVRESHAYAITKPEMVCLCRDIIHNSKPDRVVSALNQQFDRILVRGDNSFAKLSDSDPAWKKITTPTEYMGNFITSMPKRDVSIPDHERHVVVFGGGGFYKDDVAFFESLIKSRKFSSQFHDRIWDFYISENAEKRQIEDPRNPGTQINALEYIKRLAAEEGHGMIRISGPIASKKFRRELSNAAMAITRGGYNTTFELFSAHQPQLVIPRMEEEQIFRTYMLMRDGIANGFPEEFEMVSPEHRAPNRREYLHIRDALKSAFDGSESKLRDLAKRIDQTPERQASVPVLNNHGGKRTAERLIELVSKHKTHQLNLLILHDGTSLKKYDAQRVEKHLEGTGHNAILIDVKTAHIEGSGADATIVAGSERYPLSMFDAATLRSPTEEKQTKLFCDALDAAAVPIYQDYRSLELAGNKTLSQRQFEAHHIPTPRTYGATESEPFDHAAVSAFIDSLGAGPYIVKANKGWNGAQVKICQTKDEAIKEFQSFHKKERFGGAQIQEFIESNPQHRQDYRIHTITTLDAQGNPVAHVVAAAKRVAPEGEIITNTSRTSASGAKSDRLRVAISADDAMEQIKRRDGIEDKEAREKLQAEKPEILSPELADAACKAAIAFGPGSMGVDVIVDQTTKQAKVLEMNPFAGGSKKFEREHFPIYEKWAEGFAQFATYHRLAHEKQVGERAAGAA